jgi:hypothetical protein
MRIVLKKRWIAPIVLGIALSLFVGRQASVDQMACDVKSSSTLLARDGTRYADWHP